MGLKEGFVVGVYGVLEGCPDGTIDGFEVGPISGY
jgi:hypothetical protein